MKKYFYAFIFPLLLTACGEESKSSTKAVKESQSTSITPCKLMNQAVIKSFPNAKELVSKKDNPKFCYFSYTVEDRTYGVSLSLALGAGSEATLEQSVSFFKIKAPIADIGEKAYINKNGQISVWHGKNLFHITINDDAPPYKSNITHATKIAQAITDIL
jgi:hypothetical protein